MKQAVYGLILFIFLAMPPVIELTESIMAIHMHVQMPLLAVAGMLFTPLLQQTFPRFFEKWNANGYPGILLFIIVFSYWLIPRAMDDAITVNTYEIFKFISWPFLIGVPLRDSWSKLSVKIKNVTISLLAVLYLVMAWIYIFSEDQLCNNYLIVDQRTLGWSFLLVALCFIIFVVQSFFIDPTQFYEDYEDYEEV